MTSPPSGWAEEEARRFWDWCESDSARDSGAPEVQDRLASLLLAAERRGIERAAVEVERCAFSWQQEEAITKGGYRTLGAVVKRIRSLPPGGGA